MKSARVKMVVGCLRKALQPDGCLSDGELLLRYGASRDEAAFAALVRRHGPMVLGVCRRVVRHAQDAEDAFQATFLVLARKASGLRDREAVGGWLHGVAYRCALAARAVRLRRSVREQQVEDMPHPAVAPEEDRAELLAILDRELARLPEKHRVALVLCELEGRSRKEAARQLGLAEGTLSSRLARARTTLARRMAAHGAAITAASLAALLAGAARAACVPAPLMISTIRAAGGTAAPAVAALTQGVLKAMLLSKLKVAAWALAVAAAVGVGAVGWTYQAAAQPPGAPAAGGAHAARADDLEALRLEVEALRLSLQATRERVKGLEEEVQALKGSQPGAPTGMGGSMGAGGAAGMGVIPPGWPSGPGSGSMGPAIKAPGGPGAAGPGLAPGGVMGKPGGGAPGTPVPSPGDATPAPVPAWVVPGAAPGMPPGFMGAMQQFMRGAGTDPAAEVEAAAKKLRERPDDKEAMQDLERAVQRLKAKQQPDGPKPPSP